MELLRRAILVGCVLPGLWLFRLAPLDPLVTVVPVDFEARQKQEAAAVPDDRKTHEQRRNAELPLAVYVEELLQFNVYPASGPDWDRFLSGIDRAAGRNRTDQPGLFFRQDEEPIRDVLDKLSSAGGTTYISISRPGRDLHYRVDRREWTRESFRPGAGFTGRPAPPAALLYPFRGLGLAVIAIGVVLFALLPSPRRTGSGCSLTALEIGALAAGVVLFAVPLVAVGAHESRRREVGGLEGRRPRHRDRDSLLGRVGGGGDPDAPAPRTGYREIHRGLSPADRAGNRGLDRRQRHRRPGQTCTADCGCSSSPTSASCSGRRPG